MITTTETSCAQIPLDIQQRNEFVLSQMTEVHFIARRIHKCLPDFVPLEDLVHSGVLGLLEATERYDASKQIQFKTFAQFRIRGAILDSLRELDRASRRMRAKSRMLVEARATLSQKLGRTPTEEEIAEESGLDPEGLRDISVTLRALEMVDSQAAYEEGGDTVDLIEAAPANPDESPLAQLLRSEMTQLLVQALSTLSSKEQQVLSLYYREQMTMREIATILNVKRSRISQIHTSALEKLRQNLELADSADDAPVQIARMRVN